jgi:hypothetical protein
MPGRRNTVAVATSVERAALNEVRFREANERIDERRVELGLDVRTPYLCECEDERCTTVVRLRPDEYAEARRTPRTFVLSSGHRFREGDILAHRDGWMIVEKHGTAGQIAEETSG